jgi:hypothetical protein
MVRKRLLSVAIVTLALAAGSMVCGRPAFAAANTQGLVNFQSEGVGIGALAAGSCTNPAITCAPTHTCECLTGADTVIGNQSFNRGSLTFGLSIDETSSALPISTAGDCLPATGFGTLASANGKTTISLDFSGLACPTADGSAETFNGTFNVTGGTGRGNRPFTGGTGAMNGSLVGTVSRVSMDGNLQP